MRPNDLPRCLPLPALLLGCAACATTPAWQPVETGALTSAQGAQVHAAEAARDRLGKQLLGELTQALQRGEPAAAIEVCHGRAPAIASDVARELDVRIGRTSVALRNASNTAPAWAAEHVTANRGEPALFAGPHGELGALYPIRMKPLCAQCHGQPEQLDGAVKAALARLYPNDRATGFGPDDLRGWFWVEVPARD